MAAEAGNPVIISRSCRSRDLWLPRYSPSLENKLLKSPSGEPSKRTIPRAADWTCQVAVGVKDGSRDIRKIHIAVPAKHEVDSLLQLDLSMQHVSIQTYCKSSRLMTLNPTGA